MNSFFRKLLWLLQRYGKEAELRDELQFHLEQEAEERQEQGLAEDEARWAARRELGHVALVTEDTRAAWGWTRLEQLARDSGYGLRQVRNPAFSAIAIATLALGIGGITAMFSAVDAVLVRPLPYADADRLVMVWDDQSKIGDQSKHFPTPAEWLEWRRHNTVFTDIAATQPGDATLSGDSEPEQVPARKTTGNFCGLAPALRGSRQALQDGLREGGRGTAGARSHWFQHSLIGIETALAVALLTSGGLLLDGSSDLMRRQSRLVDIKMLGR
jgi:hypothetical protein